MCARRVLLSLITLALALFSSLLFLYIIYLYIYIYVYVNLSFSMSLCLSLSVRARLDAVQSQQVTDTVLSQSAEKRSYGAPKRLQCLRVLFARRFVLTESGRQG